MTTLNRRGGVEIERSSRMREIGVRSPVATDLSRKNSSTAKRSALSESYIIRGRPVSQWVLHVKESSLLNGHKCRA